MDSQITKDIINQLAIKYSISVKQVREIVFSQFAFLHETMKNGYTIHAKGKVIDTYYPIIYMRKFGVFSASDKILEREKKGIAFRHNNLIKPLYAIAEKRRFAIAEIQKEKEGEWSVDLEDVY